MQLLANILLERALIDQVSAIKNNNNNNASSSASPQSSQVPFNAAVTPSLPPADPLGEIDDNGDNNEEDGNGDQVTNFDGDNRDNKNDKNKDGEGKDYSGSNYDDNLLQLSFSPSLCARLWPFFSHGIEEVRRAAAQTLSSLLSSSKSSSMLSTSSSSTSSSSWLSSILVDAMRLVYQRVLLEDRQSVVDVLQQLWQQMLDQASLKDLNSLIAPWISSWIALGMQPQVDSFFW